MGYAKDADTLNRTTCTREVRELATVAIGVKADREIAKIRKERDDTLVRLSTEKEMREAAESYIRTIPAMCKGDFSSPCAMHVRDPIEKLYAKLSDVRKKLDNAVTNCAYTVKRLHEADAEWSARISAVQKGATEQLNLLKRIRELSVRRDEHENCKLTDAPCEDLESIERQYEAALDDYRKWEEAHPNA